ncbi:MAG: 2-oxoacid:acceptor oxidoreductase subunit alpha [Antarcticimicrobium sp.]|uniref:2-oxoacid:acceptor oxidoreductase subunit alpha n=1 Tax=Antarcticimicrobium sp. TaxID=2824147 RepID=UPI0026076C6E|nr:2-oxoacid:acceptor oxidoreductase subunit alpha [Antarcticimicrobium sp.]MDF1717756.1 2-oxoacid:acceptor oxidoreductase subunit alpha [Antarcticimicrobium sp.]
MKSAKNVSFAVVGSGGAGAITAGSILIEAAGKSGWHGLMTRSVGPQIRGGEAAALVRLSTKPAFCMSRDFDILVAIDWKNADRFIGSMPVASAGLVIADPAAGDPPAALRDGDCTIVECPIGELAKAIQGGRPNMICVGLVAQLTGLPIDMVMQVVASKLESKGASAIEIGGLCIEAGMTAAAGFGTRFVLETPGKPDSKRWLITGNEAVGLGALRGGVEFAAAYPITPATEVLEYLAPALASIGGALVQAEDELASINMIMGASYGGRPSITATSGPGLSLMMESLGLATAAEVPLVVIDVMRAGPSTGIATKSEQSDLNIAVHGFHGDAPHVVLAPLSVADCLFTAQWAVHIAETLQSPVIVLSDQSIGQAHVLIDRPADVTFLTRRKPYQAASEPYLRYAVTADGVSPMSIPGQPGGQYTADGLTHTERGTPSSTAKAQRQQMDKRLHKIEAFDFGDHWGVTEGTGDTVILTWGSLTGAVREAIDALQDDGIDVRLVALRQISPFPEKPLQAALSGAKRVLFVEQNHSGQFYRYVRSHIDLPFDIDRLNREGPDAIGPDEIASSIRDWKSQ